MCDIEGCGSQHLFEVAHAVEGRRTWQFPLFCLRKRIRPFERKPRSAHYNSCRRKKHQQVTNSTIDVEGDADRFAFELLHERYRKDLDKSAAIGKDIKDERDSE